MNLFESNRVSKGLDIWVVERFAQEKLNCDPAKLQNDLEDKYPVRGKGASIAWAEPQWVEGENEALHYRGRALKRGKMWFQIGNPRTAGFVKYFYTGWQRAVLPASALADVERAPVDAVHRCQINRQR